MGRLNIVAKEVKRDANISEQIKVGQDALNKLLDESISKFQIPNVLNPKIAIANRGLRELEKKIGKDAMMAITEAAKSPAAMTRLLETMPTTQRNKVLKALANPQEWLPKSAPGADAFSGYTAVPPIMNMLGIESQNELSR